MDKQQDLTKTKSTEIQITKANDVSPCNEEMRRAESVTKVSDVMNLAQETFKCDLDTGETLNSFDMPANVKTEMYEVKNEVTDVADPSLSFDPKEPCPAYDTSATDGDCRLEESRLIKTEFNSDDMDEIHEHALSVYESFNSFKSPEDITNLKYEIKNEEMDISYPAVDLKDSKALTEGTTSHRNYDSIIKETDKERQRVNRLSTGASKFKGDVTQSEKHLSFSCTLCDYSTDTKEYLLHHMVVHYRIKVHSESDNKYACNYCEKQFVRKIDLDDHLIQNHEYLVDSVSRKVHSCPTCNYRTAIQHNLRMHKIRVHLENNEKHSCTCCKKQFTLKIMLDDHIIQNHKKCVDLVSSKIHSCQTCDYRTAIKRNLRSHKIRVHSDNESNLREHQTRTRSENYRKHTCTCCNKQFTRKIGLDDHVVQNHENAINLVTSKIHNCLSCKYRTAIKGNLRKHNLKGHLLIKQRKTTY